MLLEKRVPLKYLLDKIGRDFVISFVIGSVTNIIAHYLSSHDYSIPFTIPLTIPGFTGTAISILLSFKLSQSYDRWWEARKVWGTIVNDSRSFVLQLQKFLPAGTEEAIKTMTYRHIAWLHALGKALRRQEPMEGLDAYLSKRDLEHISAHSNKHLAILQLNVLHTSKLMKEGKLDTFPAVQINSTLVKFSDSMGKCERIANTVFPVSYRILLRMAIYIFVVSLALALEEEAWYMELPLLMSLGTLFFALEKTAKYIQDPFKNIPTDVPITAITNTIEVNLRQLIGEEYTLKPEKKDTYYTM